MKKRFFCFAILFLFPTLFLIDCATSVPKDRDEIEVSELDKLFADESENTYNLTRYYYKSQRNFLVLYEKQYKDSLICLYYPTSVGISEDYTGDLNPYITQPAIKQVIKGNNLETFLNYSLEQVEWKVSLFNNDVPVVVINYNTQQFEFTKDDSRGKKREVREPNQMLLDFHRARGLIP